MAIWLVLTEEYGEVVPVTDDGLGPLEYGCDFVYIECEKRRDAKVLGLKLLRQQGSTWVIDYAPPCPLAGLTVEPGECQHGVGFWRECPTCAAEALEDCL